MDPPLSAHRPGTLQSEGYTRSRYFFSQRSASRDKPRSLPSRLFIVCEIPSRLNCETEHGAREARVKFNHRVRPRPSRSRSSPNRSGLTRFNVSADVSRCWRTEFSDGRPTYGSLFVDGGVWKAGNRHRFRAICETGARLRAAGGQTCAREADGSWMESSQQKS